METRGFNQTSYTHLRAFFVALLPPNRFQTWCGTSFLVGSRNRDVKCWDKLSKGVPWKLQALTSPAGANQRGVDNHRASGLSHAFNMFQGLAQPRCTRFLSRYSVGWLVGWFVACLFACLLCLVLGCLVACLLWLVCSCLLVWLVGRTLKCIFQRTT